MTAEPGHRVRNFAVGIGYFMLCMMILAALVPTDPADDTEGVAEADTTTDAEEQQANENETSADADKDKQQDKEQEQDTEPAEEVATDGGTDLAEPAATNADAEYSGDLSPEVMQAYLQSEGIDAYVIDANGTILVDHTSTAQTEEELAGEMGMIGGAYAALVGDGYPSDGMVVYLYAIDGTLVSTYEADPDDARAFANDEISAEEYALRIIETLQEA